MGCDGGGRAKFQGRTRELRFRVFSHSIKALAGAATLLAAPVFSVLVALLPVTALAFDLQGHRGARGLAPENTLEGFSAALAIGVSTLELDTGITRDGVVVVIHDRRLNPDIARRDGRWVSESVPAVHEQTLAELQRHDVGRIRPGSEYSRRFPEQRRMEGVRVPTLAALFDMVRRSGNTTVRFNIETKLSPLAPEETAPPGEFIARLLAVIREHGMLERVTIQSFDWRTLRLAREAEPRISISALTTGSTVNDPRWTAGLRLADHGPVPALVKALGADIWSPDFAGLDGASVQAAQALGLRVLPWTVNERADIDRIIDLGVDGIISDYPDRVREAMTARRMPLPPPATTR